LQFLLQGKNTLRLTKRHFLFLSPTEVTKKKQQNKKQEEEKERRSVFFSLYFVL